MEHSLEEIIFCTAYQSLKTTEKECDLSQPWEVYLFLIKFGMKNK